MNVNQSLYWYIQNIAWTWFYGGYGYKLSAILHIELYLSPLLLLSSLYGSE